MAKNVTSIDRAKLPKLRHDYGMELSGAEVEALARIEAAMVTKETSFGLEKISPAMAQYLMGHYYGANRHLSKEHTLMLTEAIDMDQWMETGDCIKFSSEAKIIDGQHRLKACAEAARTIPMGLAFGIHPRAFAVIDTGKKRSATDVLYIEGHTYPQEKATLCRSYVMVESHDYRRTRFTRPNNMQIVNWVENNDEDVMNRAINDAVNIYERHRFPKIALATALFHLRTHCGNQKKVDTFVADLTTPVMAKGSPGEALRECFNAMRAVIEAHRIGIRTETAIPMIIKAWNAHYAGEVGLQAIDMTYSRRDKVPKWRGCK